MPDSDLLTFTEFDPLAQLTVTTPRWTVTNGQCKGLGYLGKDMGLPAKYSGDFAHSLEFEIATMPTRNNFTSWSVCQDGLTDADDMEANQNSISVRIGRATAGFYYIQVLQHDGGSGIAFDWITGLSTGLHYYAGIIRDESIGSFGRMTINLYTGSLGGTLVGTVSIDLLIAKRDHRFAHAHQQGGGLQLFTPVTMWCQNYDFGESGISSAYYQQLLRKNRSGRN